jgi:hypothetical protein
MLGLMESTLKVRRKSIWHGRESYEDKISKNMGGGVTMNKETKMYAIGQENVEGNEFAMWHGPNPNLDEMLRVVGVSKRSVILEYEEAQEGLINIKVIYRWNKTIWEKV